jgi:lipoprotein-anchoring transpeptidase ErfK/SrfK
VIPYSEYANLIPYPKAPDSSHPCVLVDLSEQTLYFYRNGKLDFKTSVDTGRTNKSAYGKSHPTPVGVYRIQAKQLNQHLKGENDDGSKYDSFVYYWMPFYGGYGLHDATWRSNFGGSLYTWDGSHGCVNMPYNYAKELYSKISVGNIVKIQY